MRSDAKIKSSSQSGARAGSHDSARDGAPSQPLKLKTYQAWTMSEALSFVKEDLGADAVILHTRTFERGGFFGFGRKAVVEITAARAADMPRSEPKRSAARPSTAGAVGAAAAGALGGTRSAEHVGETVQLSAAARAYVAGGGASAAWSSRATGPGVASMDGLTGSGSAATGGTARVSADAGRDRNEAVLDMDSEREKTRRLAQAMAIQLEKQTTERANAARNERATGVAAREQQRSGGGVAGTSPLATPAASIVTTDPPGPAQRFVLVPEVRSAGTASVAGSSAGSSAGSGFTAVCTPVTAVAPSASAPAKPAQLVVAQPVVAQPVVAQPAVAQPAVAQPAVVPAVPLARHAAPTPAASVPSHSELDTISAFVGRVLSARGGVAQPDTRAVAPAVARRTLAAESANPPRAASLEHAYARLIEQEVARDLADRILADVERELSASADAGSAPTDASVRHAIERRLAALLPEDGVDPFRMRPGRNGHARRIAFVGPTGVGKTTTLAKVAAQLSLKRGLRVGIVAADTYRIAAVDQLRTYAEILNLPVAVANSPADAARACDSLGDVDVILIDTAGRSQNDRMKLAELRAFLAAAAPDETHLVLSATAGARTLSREAESFGTLGIDRLVLTKLDEAASFGTLVSLIERLGMRVSFFTNGQEVPDHMEVARGRRLATLVMGDARGDAMGDAMGEFAGASGSNAAENAFGAGIQAGSGVR